MRRRSARFLCPEDQRGAYGVEERGVKGPYVLVGHSLGALVARLYAGRYPDEVAGMVFVDHAMAIPEGILMLPPPPSDAKVPPQLPPPMPSPPAAEGLLLLESRATRTSASYQHGTASFIFGRWRKPESKRLCNQTMK